MNYGSENNDNRSTKSTNSSECSAEKCESEVNERCWCCDGGESGWQAVGSTFLYSVKPKAARTETAAGTKARPYSCAGLDFYRMYLKYSCTFA